MPDDDEPQTLAIIAEARRPILIERHRAVVEELESGIGDAFLDDAIGHPRLAAMLAELEGESARARLERLLAALAGDEHYRGAALRGALVEELCLMREHEALPAAELQLVAIGAYRALRRRFAERLGDPPPLDDLRALPCQRLALLERPLPPYGEPRLAECLPWTAGFAARCAALLERVRAPRRADDDWDEALEPPPLPADAEQHLLALPEAERAAARAALVRERIRSRFFKQVFLVYMARDEFDPREGQAHPTIRHWLEAMEATPQLFPFLQGQRPGQKAFRIARLAQKLIQLHEVYARVAVAAQQPAYREAFAGASMRERLSMLARDRYPPLQLGEDALIACLAYPFAAFVAWVQELVARREFVVPPDPRR